MSEVAWLLNDQSDKWGQKGARGLDKQQMELECQLPRFVKRIKVLGQSFTFGWTANLLPF